MKVKNIFLSLYALTNSLFIEIIGKLMVAELLALLMLPFINILNIYKKYELFRVFIWCVFFLLIGQIISDFVNASDSVDYLRGWAVIIFCSVSTIFFIQMLSDKPERIVAYLAIFGCVGLVAAAFDDISLAIFAEDTNYFKAKFATPISMLVIATVSYAYKRSPALSTIICLLYGLFCISMDARSMGLVFISSFILIILRFSNARISMPKLLIIAILTLPFLYLGYVFYVYQVIEFGFGGTNAQTQLSMTTNPYNPFELLYYGRSEFSVLLHAIADRPLTGHGSWAKDASGFYQDILTEKLGKAFVKDVDFIRAHSVILGFWAYAGLIGFISVSCLYIAIFNGAISIYKNCKSSPVFPIIVIMSLQALWSLFFSPVPVFRTELPIYAALIIVEYQRFQVLIVASKVNQGIKNAYH